MDSWRAGGGMALLYVAKGWWVCGSYLVGAFWAHVVAPSVYLWKASSGSVGFVMGGSSQAEKNVCVCGFPWCALE